MSVSKSKLKEAQSTLLLKRIRGDSNARQWDIEEAIHPLAPAALPLWFKAPSLMTDWQIDENH